jgi:hypothetical protein
MGVQVESAIFAFIVQGYKLGVTHRVVSRPQKVTARVECNGKDLVADVADQLARDDASGHVDGPHDPLVVANLANEKRKLKTC